MRGGPLLSIAAAVLALAVAGCGGDDETTSDASAGTTGEDFSCVESFTSSAPDFLPRLARFSHEEGSPVTIGTYSGSEFSAETYDEGTEGDGSKVVVAQGACVVTEIHPRYGPLYIFVVADDGAWHRLLESDPAVPLVPDPERDLEDIQHVEIEQIGA
jgi:hypothetical protein